MTSTFFGLDLAYRALLTQQTALDVTNHNVANANTPGFSRQAVEMVTTVPYTMPGMNRSAQAGQLGTGVMIGRIDRLRDSFLDLQYRTEVGNQRQAEVTRDALEEVEVVLNEPSDSGISSLLGQFFSSWQDLTNDPTDTATRAAVIQRSAGLATAFNRSSQRLSAIQTDLNNTVSFRVTEINNYASQIASLNTQIVQIEVSGQRANDFRDRRDYLLDQMSGLVQVASAENPDGSLNVTIGGHAYVTIGTVDNLTTTPTGPGGLLQVRFTSDSALTTLGNSELNGIIQARDVNLPGYMTKLDAVVGDLITAVNGLHTTGYGLDGVTGRAFFTGTTAATMAVSATISADPQRIGAASAAGQAGNSAIALAIAQLRSTMVPTSEASYSSLITGLGVDSQTNRNLTDNQTLLVQLIERRRQQVSGVSLDEEAVQMVRYQRAYEAAARLITAYDEMLDKLINGMGIVGR